jgi:replicative superfamily II helicase
MTDVYCPPVRTRVGFETSIDRVQKQSYSTSTVVGVKRNHEAVTEESIPSNCMTELVRTANKPAPLVPQGPRLKAGSVTSATITGQEINLEPSEYTQRRNAASTPVPKKNPLLSLVHPKYGLPDSVISNLASMGVHSVYPWQSSCLLGKGILSGERNLVYTAPTGGGKSLVADILLLKKVIEQPTKKAILVLPYVALVQEKLKWLRRVLEGVSKQIDIEEHPLSNIPSSKWKNTQSCIRLAGFFGGSRAKTTWADIDIAVCTIEKANSLVNTAIENGKIDQLGIVVLDELHMLDEENRGYLIELMVTKLLCLQQGIQLIGMTATLSNPRLIADWLEAKFYVSKYRPVPIEEHLVYENAIYATANAKQFFRTASRLSSNSSAQKPPIAARTIEKSLHRELDNSLSNAVVALAIETATSGYGALVFCSSRQRSQATAVLISDAMPTEQISTDILDKRSDLIASLQALPGGFESTFTKTILCGVAFHHAGTSLLSSSGRALDVTGNGLPVALSPSSRQDLISWLTSGRSHNRGARNGRRSFR